MNNNWAALCEFAYAHVTGRYVRRNRCRIIGNNNLCIIVDFESLLIRVLCVNVLRMDFLIWKRFVFGVEPTLSRGTKNFCTNSLENWRILIADRYAVSRFVRPQRHTFFTRWAMRAFSSILDSCEWNAQIGCKRSHQINATKRKSVGAHSLTHRFNIHDKMDVIGLFLAALWCGTNWFVSSATISDECRRSNYYYYHFTYCGPCELARVCASRKANFAKMPSM